MADLISNQASAKTDMDIITATPEESTAITLTEVSVTTQDTESTEIQDENSIQTVNKVPVLTESLPGLTEYENTCTSLTAETEHNIENENQGNEEENMSDSEATKSQKTEGKSPAETSTTTQVQQARLRLIKAVESRPLLYDKAIQNTYSGSNFRKERQAAWRAVLKEIQQAGFSRYFRSVLECQTKWNSCKKVVRRYILATEGARKLGETAPEPDIWWKYLKFLVPQMLPDPSKCDLMEKRQEDINLSPAAEAIAQEPSSRKSNRKRSEKPRKKKLSRQGDNTRRSNMAKMKLIVAVQKRPAIYDPSNPLTLNANNRAEAWREILNELHAEGLAYIFPNVETVKQRWKRIRMPFVRWLLRINERRKSGLPDRSQMPKLWSWLKFLVPHVLKDTSMWDLSTDEKNLTMEDEPHMYISSESEDDHSKIRQVTTIVMTNGGDNMPRFHAIGHSRPNTVEMTSAQNGVLNLKPTEYKSRKRQHCESSDEEIDDLDSWAKMVAVQLRALPEARLRDKLKLDIIQLLNKARYGQARQ